VDRSTGQLRGAGQHDRAKLVEDALHDAHLVRLKVGQQALQLRRRAQVPHVLAHDRRVRKARECHVELGRAGAELLEQRGRRRDVGEQPRRLEGQAAHRVVSWRAVEQLEGRKLDRASADRQAGRRAPQAWDALRTRHRLVLRLDERGLYRLDAVVHLEDELIAAFGRRATVVEVPVVVAVELLDAAGLNSVAEELQREGGGLRVARHRLLELAQRFLFHQRRKNKCMQVPMLCPTPLAGKRPNHPSFFLKYEAGFDTSKPKLITVPRREVYANRKHKQELSPEALALAKSRAKAEVKARGTTAPKDTAPKPESPEYMSLLYLDAERALPSLHDLGGDITKALPDVEPIVAPLKGEARACFKTVDKYAGDARRLTDLARMTEVFDTARGARGAALPCQAQRLRDRADEEPADARLRRQRDGRLPPLLLNVEIVGSKHIVELQITLTPLLAVKAGGGHAAYQIARVHGFFEEDVYHYEGSLSAAVLGKLRCGILRELVCNGTSVGLAKHFDSLLAALRAPSCQLQLSCGSLC